MARFENIMAKPKPQANWLGSFTNQYGSNAPEQWFQSQYYNPGMFGPESKGYEMAKQGRHGEELNPLGLSSGSYAQYWSPEDVRKGMMSGQGGQNYMTRNVTDDQVYDRWNQLNTHADRFRNDPAYAAQYNEQLASANPVGNLANDIAPIVGLGLVGGEFAGLGGSASGTPGVTAGATGAVNPMGSGFTGTGPGVATAGALNGASSLGTNAGGNYFNSGGSAMNSSIDPWLIGGSSLLSGYLSNEASGDAMDELRRQYDLNRADQEPWRQAGVNALGRLENFNIEDDPIYQYQLDQAKKATERGAAARGFNLSTNVLNDLNDRAIGEAGRYYGDAWNRQAGLAGVGQTAVTNMANQGTNTANNLANLQMQQGQGWNNALQGGISNYLTYQNNQNNPFNSFLQNYYRSIG